MPEEEGEQLLEICCDPTQMFRSPVKHMMESLVKTLTRNN